MAFVLTRALGRLHLSSCAPRLLSTTLPRTLVTPKPAFSFSQTVGGRSLQVLETQAVSFAAFSTKVRCSKSAEKRHRQSEKRRARNKARKVEVKYRMKRVLKALDGFKKEKPKELTDLDPVTPLMQAAWKAIDKAVEKGTMHNNTAARRKSRLSRARNRLLVEAGIYKPVEKPKPPSLVEAYEARMQARRDAAKKLMQEVLAEKEASMEAAEA